MTARSTAGYTGRVIVRFTEAVAAEIVSNARTIDGADSLDQPGILGDHAGDVLSILHDVRGFGSPLVPAVGSFSVSELQRMEEKARRSPFPPVHTLASYFIAPRERPLLPLELEGLLRSLSSLPSVDAAFPERVLREPSVNPSQEPYYTNGDQGYADGDHENLSTTGSGINASSDAVWGTFDGSGIGLVTLERGWHFAHEDLCDVDAVRNAANPSQDLVLHGVNKLGDVAAVEHGTMTLGVILGQQNGRGIIGLAPKAKLVGVVSRVSVDGSEWDIVGAILSAVRHMSEGDVLLLEVQTVDEDVFSKPKTGSDLSGYPLEIDDMWFDAIRLASGNGIVVIEPAGNGGRDLDSFEADWGAAPWWRSLKMGSPNFYDSGAIMVSACRPELHQQYKHLRLTNATFGSRVNCYAWGSGVSTTDAVPDGAGTYRDDGYGFYHNTSAASAIIAGAAILVQDMYVKTRGWRLQPAQLRALLSNASHPTKILDPDTEQGEDGDVMPDLEHVASMLSLVPDVYIRDSLTDDGTVPQALVFQSPDIVVRSASPPSAGDPMNDPAVDPPSDAVRVGADNYVYVRLHNRNPVDAVDVRVRVFWSEASSLVCPTNWNPIVHHLTGEDCILASVVEKNNKMMIAGPLVWHPDPGEVPEHGGCFIALADHPLDPEPPLLLGNGVAAGWSDFLAYVGANNNVAWRNFKIAEPDAAGEWTLNFVVRGAVDRILAFDFEFAFHLPPDAIVSWETPAKLDNPIRAARWLCRVDRDRLPQGSRWMLPHDEPVRIVGVRLARFTELAARLRIRTPASASGTVGTVAVRQMVEAREVGRMTWELRRT